MNRQKAARVDGSCNKRQREPKMPVGVGRTFAPCQFPDVIDWHDISLHWSIQKVKLICKLFLSFIRSKSWHAESDAPGD